MHKVVIVAAVDEAGGIGINGKLPWDVPEDRAFFRHIVENQAVVMGHKTSPTIPQWVGIKERLIGADMGKAWLANQRQPSTLFVAGGAKTYAEMMPHVTHAIITRIKGVHEADTFMPEIPPHVHVLDMIPRKLLIRDAHSHELAAPERIAAFKALDWVKNTPDEQFIEGEKTTIAKV